MKAVLDTLLDDTETPAILLSGTQDEVLGFPRIGWAIDIASYDGEMIILCDIRNLHTCIERGLLKIEPCMCCGDTTVVFEHMCKRCRQYVFLSSLEMSSNPYEYI